MTTKATEKRRSWMEAARSPEGSVSEKPGHAILTCRSCKRRGTRSYTLRTVTRIRGERSMPVSETSIAIDGAERFGRLDQRRPKPVAWAVSRPCPDCGSGDVRVNVVEGELSDTSCGARCMGATGSSCECSCAGRNHGSSHGSW